jgi:hypothetical protein
MKQPGEDFETSGINGQTVSVLAMCKRHNRPMRRGQRNCDQCNREANQKYRRNRKRDEEMLKEIAARICRRS